MTKVSPLKYPKKGMHIMAGNRDIEKSSHPGSTMTGNFNGYKIFKDSQIKRCNAPVPCITIPENKHD